MKIYNQKFELNSRNLKKELIISLFADIHNTKYIKKELYYKIIENIKKDRPDLILIPGDFIYTADDLIEEDNKNKLIYLFSELIKIAPTVISIGNHDYKNGKILNYNNTLKFFKDFEKNNTGLFYVLENKIIKIGDINIVGVSPRFETYYMKYKEKWMDYFFEALSSLKESLNDGYTIFMTHSPETLSESENSKDNKFKEILNKADLFVCGHCHDGFVPKHWQKLGIYKGDKGICASEGESFKESTLRIVSKCRGVHDLYNGKLIITGGITKWCQPNPVFPFINNFWSKDITIIKIKKTK